MSHKKCKLVLRADVGKFEIVKAVNTLEFGVPGDLLIRGTVDKILSDNNMRIRKNELIVEFIR